MKMDPMFCRHNVQILLKRAAHWRVKGIRSILPGDRAAFPSMGCNPSYFQHSLDGSVCLEDIAKYLHVSPDAIATAALPDEDGKRHLLIFELATNGH